MESVARLFLYRVYCNQFVKLIKATSTACRERLLMLQCTYLLTTV